VVDGQENPLSLILASRFHEVQKHLTLWNYSADSIGLLTNDKLWSTLSPRERELLTAAAKDAAAWHRQAQISADAQALEQIRQRLQVVTLSDAELAAFRRAMEALYAEWEPVVGADLLKAVRAAGSR